MADEFVENILKSWNMSELIEHFKNEGIDEEAFKMLDDETINAVIGKAGHRLKFKAKLKQFNVENWITHSPASASTESVMSPSASTSFSSSLEDIEPSESTSFLFINSDIDNNNSFVLMPPPPNPEVSSPKKGRYTSMFKISLEDFLTQSVDGRDILLHKQEGSLNNALRNKLVYLILSYLVNIDKNIPPNTFKRVAQEIAELFTGENPETYYIPYRPKTKTSPKIAPKGKLYSKYVNIRAQLTSETHSADSGDHTTYSVEGSVNPSNEQEIQEKLAFLKHSTQPWDRVVEYWEATALARKPLAETLSIADYIELFPPLKQNDGFVLIELDFKILYADKENTLYSQWAKFSTAVEKEALLRKLKLPFDTDIKDIDPFILILLELSYLFPPVTIGNKRKGKNWRPSKIETQESFILLISNLGLLEEKLQQRKAILRSANLTLQPFFVVVKDGGDGPSYFVIINDVKYKVDGVLKALDVTFKCFHVFNAKYPAESGHIWLLIQKMVYDLITPYDNEASATYSVMADLRKHM